MNVFSRTEDDKIHPSNGDSKVKACQKQISKLVGDTCEQMANQVCEIIKAHMPIQVDQ